MEEKRESLISGVTSQVRKSCEDDRGFSNLEFKQQEDTFTLFSWWDQVRRCHHWSFWSRVTHLAVGATEYKTAQVE
jgi:hypothetical protein